MQQRRGRRTLAACRVGSGAPASASVCTTALRCGAGRGDATAASSTPARCWLERHEVERHLVAVASLCSAAAFTLRPRPAASIARPPPSSQSPARTHSSVSRGRSARASALQRPSPSGAPPPPRRAHPLLPVAAPEGLARGAAEDERLLTVALQERQVLRAARLQRGSLGLAPPLGRLLQRGAEGRRLLWRVTRAEHARACTQPRRTQQRSAAGEAGGVQGCSRHRAAAAVHTVRQLLDSRGLQEMQTQKKRCEPPLYPAPPSLTQAVTVRTSTSVCAYERDALHLLAPLPLLPPEIAAPIGLTSRVGCTQA
jgi:hypothetical protein